MLGIAFALVLTACDGGKKPAASQTAAKVNKQEITVHQINFMLQQQRNLKPEMVDAASRQALERLIEQELAVQNAEESKLDRDPVVMQQIEASRREILARAYLERVAANVARPSQDEVAKYFESKPALFKQRRIYNLEEFLVEAKPEQLPAIREKLAAVRQISEFTDYLKANGLRFTSNRATRAAEQLPLGRLDELAQLRDGQAVFTPSARGAQVLVLVSSALEPATLTQASPVIEQFLINERKRQEVQKHMKDLRSAATVSYVGKYAEAASGAASGTAPAVITPATAEPAASGLDNATISKGMGLK